MFSPYPDYLLWSLYALFPYQGEGKATIGPITGLVFKAQKQRDGDKWTGRKGRKVWDMFICQNSGLSGREGHSTSPIDGGDEENLQEKMVMFSCK